MRHKRQSLAFILAAGLHAGVFAAAGMAFVTPSQFGVDTGTGGVEVVLIAAAPELPLPVPPPSIPEPLPEAFIPEAVLSQPVTPLQTPQPMPPAAPSKPKAQDEQNVVSRGGAMLESKPDYLRNPAPEYPREARRRGQQGLVILDVRVSKDGRPLSVEIKNPSGIPSLDAAALKAVQRWLFAPARVGNIAVDARVEVPVRFRIQNIRT